MTSKWTPEGTPKTNKNRYQTVISVFGRALVRVLPRPSWSWILTATGGQDDGQKDSKRGGKWGPSTTQGSLLERIKVFSQAHAPAIASGVGQCLHVYRV